MLRPLNALTRRGLVRSLHAIVLPASASYLSSGYSRFSSSKTGSTGSQGPPRPNGRDDPTATRVRKEILEAALRHVVSHGWTDALTAGAQECGCVGWFSWHGTCFFPCLSLFPDFLTTTLFTQPQLFLPLLLVMFLPTLRVVTPPSPPHSFPRAPWSWCGT